MACEGSDEMVKGGFCAPAELFWSDYLANTLGVTGRGHWCAAHMINHSLHTFLCRHHSNRNCVVLSKQQAVGNKGHQIPQKEDELELGIGMRYCMLYLCPSPWLTDGSTTVQSSRTLPHIFDTAPIWQQVLSADRWTVRNGLCTQVPPFLPLQSPSLLNKSGDSDETPLRQVCVPWWCEAQGSQRAWVWSISLHLQDKPESAKGREVIPCVHFKDVTSQWHIQPYHNICQTWWRQCYGVGLFCCQWKRVTNVCRYIYK